jgi:hypothetical protein
VSKTALTQRAAIDSALAALSDRSLSIDDRAAAYGVLHQVQLRMNRALRAVKDELITHLVSNDLRELGPLSVKYTAFDVEWPCNDEENWADLNVQEAMETYAKIAPDYFRHVPEHWEVRTAELGQGIAEGDPVAKQLHRQMKEHGWRVEGGRRASLAVKEVREVKAA